MQLNGIKFVAALMATLKFFLSLLLLFVCFLLVPFFFHYYTLLSPSFTFSVSFFISCLMEPDITLLRHNGKKKFLKLNVLFMCMPKSHCTSVQKIINLNRSFRPCRRKLANERDQCKFSLYPSFELVPFVVRTKTNCEREKRLNLNKRRN